MFAYKIHAFVDLLNTSEIRFCIICKFYFLTTSDTFCAPVEISEIYRTSYFACNSVET